MNIADLFRYSGCCSIPYSCTVDFIFFFPLEHFPIFLVVSVARDGVEFIGLRHCFQA
jgi:hypothetical protein